MTGASGPQPRNAALTAYRRPTPSRVPLLKLDANEGPVAPIEPLLDTLRQSGAELFRRYPDATALESALAQRFGVDPGGARCLYAETPTRRRCG